MANTYSLMQVWEDMYQVTHYKQPVFRAFAEEKFSPKLKEGATFTREYASDLVVNAMGSNGSYSVQGFTNTPENGVVNIKEESSIQIVKWQELQDHLPTQMKYTTKAANALWTQVDATVLYTMGIGAASVIDDAVINGAAGVVGKPVLLGVQNIQSIFGAAIQQFQLNNVDYEPNKSLSKDVKLETISNVACAAISPQVYNFLMLYLGGKTTVLGDTISRNGHSGLFMGFNLFVSNNLTWEGILQIATKPTDGDTITLLSGVTVNGVSQAITLTFKDTPVAAGQVMIADSGAAATITNLVNALKAPYTLIANSADAGYYPLVQGSLTAIQQKALYNVHPVQTAVATLGGASNAAGTYLDLFIAGMGNVPVAETLTAAADTWGYQAQHNLFGTSKSVSLLMQQVPHLFINPVSGQVARDLVTWNLYGVKVFYDQTFQLIDCKVDCSSFGANGTPLNQFN